MTTKSPQELAASLRTISGARRHHSFTGHGEPVFVIMGNAERLHDLELAASVLEDLVGANSMLNSVLGMWLEKTEWVQAESQAGKLPVGMLGRHRADVMTEEIKRLREMLAVTINRDGLRVAARAVIAEDHGNSYRADAIERLCIRLGVVL